MYSGDTLRMGIALSNPLLSWPHRAVSTGAVSSLANESGGTVWIQCVFICVCVCVCMNLLTTGQSAAPAAESSRSVFKAAQLCPAESNLWSSSSQRWQEETLCYEVHLDWKYQETPGFLLCFYTKSPPRVQQECETCGAASVSSEGQSTKSTKPRKMTTSLLFPITLTVREAASTRQDFQ